MNTKYQCRKCGKTFKTQSEMVSHTWKEHRSKHTYTKPKSKPKSKPKPTSQPESDTILIGPVMLRVQTGFKILSIENVI